MTAPRRLAWLFDVDGTLITTEGAAKRAFSESLLERCGVTDDLADISFGGRTDPLILAAILRKHGLVFTAEDEARFWDEVFRRMEGALRAPRGRLLAGVAGLIDEVEREPGWVLGLLTGNMTQMARLKLGHFGVHHRFELGAFGEEGPDRDSIARLAVERVRRRYGLAPEACLVIGDTEHDIACARAAGARAVAVATGFRARDFLERHRPDLLLDDLADPAPLLAWARGLVS